jgi:hypothetical protein
MTSAPVPPSPSIDDAWRRMDLRIRHLAGLDRQCAAFGAGAHGYDHGAPVGDAELEAAEARLGQRLPDELRSRYRTLGDGGVGPCYGLRPLASLLPFRPAEAFPGVAPLAVAHGADEDGYFEVPYDELTGLVAAIDLGCGHLDCVVTAGDAIGAVIGVSCDGLVTDDAPSLLALYDRWVEREITSFERVRAAMETATTIEEIAAALRAQGDRGHADALVASLADVPRPAARP